MVIIDYYLWKPFQVVTLKIKQEMTNSYIQDAFNLLNYFL